MTRSAYKHKPRSSSALVLQKPEIVQDDQLRGMDTSVSYAAFTCASASSCTLYFRVHAEDVDLLSEVFNPILEMPYELIAAIRYIKTVLQAGGPVCTFEASMRRLPDMSYEQKWLLRFTARCQSRAANRPPGA